MMALVRGEDERDGHRGHDDGGGEYDCGDAPARFSPNAEPRQRAHAEVWRSLGRRGRICSPKPQRRPGRAWACR